MTHTRDLLFFSASVWTIVLVAEFLENISTLNLVLQCLLDYTDFESAGFDEGPASICFNDRNPVVDELICRNGGWYDFVGRVEKLEKELRMLLQKY